MGSQTSLYLVLLLACYCFPSCDSYHGIHPVDCWTLNATADNEHGEMRRCNGLDLVWEKRPPPFVSAGTEFYVSYQAIGTETFYTRRPGFDWLNASLEEFCMKECPNVQNALDLSREDCCVWHANVHTCHPTGRTPEPICGPWVNDDGVLSTHTPTLYGPISTVFEASVRINHPGTNRIIAHLWVGSRQIAIQEVVEVIECGDGICTAEFETCDPQSSQSSQSSQSFQSCKQDCCAKPFPWWAIVVIVVFCVLVPIVIALTALGWYCCQRYVDSSHVGQTRKNGTASQLTHEGAVMNGLEAKSAM